MTDPAARAAIVFRGERSPTAAPTLRDPRLNTIVAALTEAGIATELAPYSDETADQVRDQLLAVDAALVWVDPVTVEGDRARLDSILREVAERGVFVSAHPDAILKMGTKEVLYRTRQLGWGSDTHLYETVGEFREAFPERVQTAGPRVLKQYRGNGGDGVWKVELLASGGPSNPGAPANWTRGAMVRVQHARPRDTATEDLPLFEFMQRCEAYFGSEPTSGRLIDQAFQPRIVDGMIRCYLVKNEVVGFARQFATGRSPEEEEATPAEAGRAPAAGDRIFGLPSAKTMYGPDEPRFDRPRAKIESEWLPGMQGLVDVPTGALPLLWDADFLFGPPDASGADSYVLCEINVSCVTPFPEEAPSRLAECLRRTLQGRSA